MNRLIAVLLLAGMTLAGCTGVALDARHSDLLAQQTAQSAIDARQAQAGLLTEEQMVQRIVAYSIWTRNLYNDSKGVKSDAGN